MAVAGGVSNSIKAHLTLKKDSDVDQVPRNHTCVNKGNHSFLASRVYDF